MIGKNETIKSIKVHNIWGKYEIFSLFYYMLPSAFGPYPLLQVPILFGEAFPFR